ncbi:MAG: hypothetical protein Q8M24_02025 [Pseudolabrys sp.]|nr:hypothetical protein [Pseudolabrys sp.]MDP2294225.1 hypothetical protein [Pseudolabrys sp.]
MEAFQDSAALDAGLRRAVEHYEYRPLWHPHCLGQPAPLPRAL